MRRLAAAFAAAWAVVLCGALFAPLAAEALPPTGITGAVTNTIDNAPVEGVEVCALQSGTKVKCASTGSNGEYTVEGLTAGEYEATFVKAGFETASRTGVQVTSGTLTPVDVALVEVGEGAISGTVTDAANGQPIAGIMVCTYGSEACAETGATGVYTLSGLHVNTYTVYFAPAQACEEELGEKIRCAPKVNFVSQSVTSVRVRASQTTTANAALTAGGEVSGTVTNASIGHPALDKVEVCATHVNAKGEEPFGEEAATEKFEYSSGCGYTNAAGQYTIAGLSVAGAYKVEFDGYICTVVQKGKVKERECPELYVGQYYSGQQTFKNAGAIAVALGANTGGVNETLREAFPVAPASSAAPVASGTPAVGGVLTCSAGGWTHEPLFLTYQWLRDGAPIAGQSATTYTVQGADEGHSLSCMVQAGNGAGLAGATSNALAVGKPIATAARVAKVKGASALVKLSCTGGAACSGSFKLVATEVVKRHRKRLRRKVTIGQAHFAVAAGKTITIRVHLSAEGRKLLGKSAGGKLAAKLAGSGVKARALVLESVSKRAHSKKTKKKGKHRK